MNRNLYINIIIAYHEHIYKGREDQHSTNILKGTTVLTTVLRIRGSGLFGSPGSGSVKKTYPEPSSTKRPCNSIILII